MYQYLKIVVRVGTGNFNYFQKPKGLPDENITAPTTSDYRVTLQLSYLGTKTRLEFRGSCLKQDRTKFNHGKVVNTYIVHELNKIMLTIFMMGIFGAAHGWGVGGGKKAPPH